MANVTETAMPVPHISVIATIAGITVTDISGAVNAAVMAVHLENAVGIEIKIKKSMKPPQQTKKHVLLWWFRFVICGIKKTSRRANRIASPWNMSMLSIV